jgi:coenzyme PQQ precursor peptide PqqA
VIFLWGPINSVADNDCGLTGCFVAMRELFECRAGMCRAGGVPSRRKLRWDRRNPVRCERPVTINSIIFLEKIMWTKPEFTEMRFGFEVTMYIANR